MTDTKKQNDDTLYLPYYEVYHATPNGIDNSALFDEKKLKSLISFRNSNSLDHIELFKCLEKYRRNKKKPTIKYSDYLLVNLLFEVAKGKKDKDDVFHAREYLYEKGFYLNGQHYVRYKRTSGSSRDGRCLFIIEQLYDEMNHWTECGIEFDPTIHNLSSFEAYKSLTMSSIEKCISIPLDHILFVKDKKVTFTDSVVEVTRKKDSSLKSTIHDCEIENNVFDGEGLIDDQVFIKNGYEKSHMLLLRNRFFKACCFRTKLQKWFHDNNITTIEQLKDSFSQGNDADKKHKKKTGIVTFAKSIEDIEMVVSESCLKFLKFYDGFSEKNIRRWTNIVDDSFGVVKTDKAPKFCFGKQVSSSYQLLNTVNLQKEDVDQLFHPYIDAIYNARNDPTFFAQFISGFINLRRDKKIDESSISDETENEYQVKGNLIMELLKINPGFSNVDFYYDFQDSALKVLKDRARCGKCYLTGTNATLFGNGPEYLKYIIGKWDGKSSVLKPGYIRTNRFDEDDQKLLCVRYPHITMGNVYLVRNDLCNDPIWDYFDIGEHIVHVNAVNENIQQRLNGCDYDSDTMFIINNPILVSHAEKQDGLFLVPVSNIDLPTTNHSVTEVAKLDDINANSGKDIGKIVDLSQFLNSILWDKINNHISTFELTEEEKDIYGDICILAVLSGIEIDRAKRDYGIDTATVIKEIKEKYKAYKYPQFFSIIQNSFHKDKLVKVPYKTTMEYVRQVELKRTKNVERCRSKIVGFLRKDLDSTETDKKKAKDFLSEYKELTTEFRKKEKMLRSKSDEGKDESVYTFEELLRKNKIDEKDAIRDCMAKYDILKPGRIKAVFILSEKGDKKSKKSFYWNLYYPLLKELIEDSKSKEILKEIFITEKNPHLHYELSKDEQGLKYFDFYLKLTK